MKFGTTGRVWLAYAGMVVFGACGNAAGAEPTAAPGKILVVSARAALEAAVVHREPTYPATARQFRLDGEVEAEFIVGLNGKVENVAILKGNPIFNPSVVNALKGWSFMPFMAEGRPARAKSTITFFFKR
jgi:TonB family protein